MIKPSQRNLKRWEIFPSLIAMESLGTLVEILNKDAVLIQSDKELSINRNLIVFSRVSLPQLKEKYGLEFLDFRKGEIVISLRQGNFYVGTVYRPTVERKRTVERPGALSAILGQEILREEVPGSPSATLAEPTLNIQVSDRVEVGDHVGNE